MRKFLYVLLTVFLMTLSACGSKQASSSQKDQDDQFTFAFLTDIHVEYDKNADQGFQQAVNHVNKLAPDFVITGGDLIADALGQTEETAKKRYALYNEIQDGFEMPVYNTIGNHEEFGIYVRSGISRDHELYGHKMYESLVGKRFYTFTENGWKFYILDSVEETEDRRYFGHVDSVQIEWLRSDLKTTPDSIPLVIVTHIPLLTAIAQIRDGSMAANSKGLVIENSKEVLDLFGSHNLKMVLQGHLHHLEDIYVNGIHFITGGAVSAGWWEGPVNGIDEGFLLIRVNEEELKWEYVDFGWEVNN